jgi:membrane protein implicated in regulation of membrane protease activity
MLMVYLVTLIAGGLLLAITLVLGGSADADTDAGEVDADGDADHGALDVFLGWLPVTSLRFWTFFAAFFGGVGTVLTAWDLAGPVAAGGLAVAAGYLSGLLMDRSLRYLKQADSDSSVGGADVIGAGGLVLLPVASGGGGKVRVHLKGRTIDLLAHTDDDDQLAAGQHVMVLSMRDDGHVLVTRGDKLDKVEE